jgi:hypothetical protein
MVGVFYKYIIDPIEYRIETAGMTAYFMPRNLGEAHNAGLEIDVTKYFRRFGAKANYTFTNSRITTDKWVRMANPNYPHLENWATIVVEKPQTRPLFGQAAHVANFSLLYKDAPRGWDGQIALSYTDKRLAEVSQYFDQDMWQAGFLRLDASVDKHFERIGLTIFAKASNLLDTPMYQYINPNPDDDMLTGRARKNRGLLDRKEYYGRNITIGVKYKL